MIHAGRKERSLKGPGAMPPHIPPPPNALIGQAVMASGAQLDPDGSKADGKRLRHKLQWMMRYQTGAMR
jgi:hypothetical protein